jgi:hypothetical protein
MLALNRKNFKMNYDKIFDNSKDINFFYTGYPGNKLMVGKVSLKFAVERMQKNEYYVLVTYKEGESLPAAYKQLPNLVSEDDTLFATINPEMPIQLSYICRDNGIQLISRLGSPKDTNPNFLLGPGPDTLSLNELVMEQYSAYYDKDTNRSI